MGWWYDFNNLIRQTDEAEIKVYMTTQRVRGAEIRAGNSLSNGPLRVQSNVSFDLKQSILQREGIRQLPGI